MVSIWEKFFEKFQIKDSFRDIKVLCSDSKKVEVKIESLTLNIINPQLATGEVKTFVDGVIAESYQQRAEIIDCDADSIGSDYVVQLSNIKFHEIVNFFSSKLSSTDMVMLESALYLRKLFERDERAKCRKVKEQIMTRYGARGGNLCNLCTAGYLENSIIPLFQELDKSTPLSVSEFRTIFYDLIDGYPTAVFVHQYMTKDDINSKVFGKIKENVEFGIYELTIHGIGNENIKTIQKTVEQIKNKSLGKAIDIKVEGRAIKVKLTLFPNPC